MTNTFKATITLPVSIIETMGKTGMNVRIPLSEMPDMMLIAALRAGFTKTLNDITKDTDAERLDAWEAKIAGWKLGNWTLGRGPANGEMVILRNAYDWAQARACGATSKQVAALCKATVQEVFGDDTKATMETFINAYAIKTLRDSGTAKPTDAQIAEAVEAFKARLHELAAEQAKASEGLSLDV